MFTQSFEERMFLWKEHRGILENCHDPVQESINFFEDAPVVSIAANPYDKESWPSPWELIHENVYCNFIKILAICYTLQLTTRFSESSFRIEVLKDKARATTEYVLIIDDYAIVGLEDYYGTYASVSDIPETTFSEVSFDMPSLK